MRKLKSKMGGYLASFHVRDRDREQVLRAVRFGRFTPAWVSPRSGPWVSVFPAAAESHDAELLNRMGGALSRSLSGVVWSAVIHDSRALLYTLFREGEIEAEYDSFPELTGVNSSPYRRLTDGRPQVMARLCPEQVPVEALESVLYRMPLSQAMREVAREEKLRGEQELHERLPEAYVHERVMHKRGWASEELRLSGLAALLKIDYALYTYTSIDDRFRRGDEQDLPQAGEFVLVR